MLRPDRPSPDLLDPVPDTGSGLAGTLLAGTELCGT